MAEKKVTTLKIQYVRSTIGRPKKHKKIVRSLGLRKLNQVVEHQDNSAMRGAAAKVPHLVRIVDGE